MKTCVCSPRDLFNFGCRCLDNQLYVWFNGSDYIVAQNKEEANFILWNTFGFAGSADWLKLSPDKEITVEEDEDVFTTLTAEKWVQEIGHAEYLDTVEP